MNLEKYPLDLIAHSFRAKKDFKDDVNSTEAEIVYNESFPICVLPEFLERDSYDKLKQSVLEQPFFKKQTDLYKFIQTRDLNECSDENIRNFKNHLISTEFISFVQRVCGIELIKKIDFSSQSYGKNSYLLCHDDAIEEGKFVRRIAFVFYMVSESFNENDGGFLQTFSSKNNQPHCLKSSILPKSNTFVFFEVSPNSFHQVSEVLGEDKPRISIVGWLYGPDVHKISSTPIPTSTLLYAESFIPEGPYRESSIDLNDYLNKEYLETKVINELFCEESVVSLHNFLLDSQAVFNYDINSITSSNIPLNLGRFSNIHMKRLNILMDSEEFRKYIEELTSLSLYPSVSKGESFGFGDYTLLTSGKTNSQVDVYFFFLQTDWDSKKYGGNLVYTDDDGNCICSQSPVHNSLIVVYREEGVHEYIEYINSSVGMNSNNRMNYYVIRYPVVCEEIDR